MYIDKYSVYKSTLICTFICMIFIILIPQAFTSQSTRIFKPPALGSQKIGKYLGYLGDKNGIYTINDVATGKAGVFIPSEVSAPGFGFTETIYWIRFTVDMSNYKEPFWYLVQNYEHISNLVLYYFADGSYIPIELGNELPIEERHYQLRNFVFKVPTPKASPATYYLRADSKGKWLQLDLSWSNTKALIESTSVNNLMFGLFFGGLLVMLVYNMFLYISIRDRAYLYYIYYLTCFIVSFFFINGYAPLTFELNPSYNYLFTIFVYLTLHGVILFARQFLDLTMTIPWLDKILRIFQYIFFVVGIAALTILNEGKSYELSIYIILLASPFLVLAGIIRWRQRFNAARLYLAGWAIFITLVFIYGLQTLSIVQSNLFTNYGLQMGAVWESVLFALALAQRTKDLQQARDRALIEVEQNRKFSNRITKLLEFERKTIASEIHDKFNPTLIAIKLHSEEIVNLSSDIDNNQKICNLSNKIVSMATNGYSSSRKLVKRLRPEIIDTLGLVGALEELVTSYDNISNQRSYVCNITGDYSDIDENISIAIYRVVQEAIINTIKHTSATEVKINLTNLDGFQLTIEDNGEGMKSDNVVENGIGLISMKEQIYSVGGELKINSVLERGTQISAMIPAYSPAQNDD